MTGNKRRKPEVQTRENRFLIKAPANFSWRSRNGVLHKAQGMTRDVSSHGVFICTRQMPRLRVALEVDIAVGSLEANGRITRLQGTGKVLRIDTSDGQSMGFALAVKFAIADMRIFPNPQTEE